MDKERLREHKLRNNLQTLGLVATLALLLGYLAWLLGGPSFVWAAVLGVLLLFLTHPVGSPRLILTMYRARPIRPEEAPRLYVLLQELTRRAGLGQMPMLYYLPTSLMNAFATGRRDDAVIALSDGLIRRLELRELAAVMAHELSHIANGDIQVMAFADLVSRITGALSLVGQLLLIMSLPLILLGAEPPPWVPILVLIAAPSLSALVQLALSRNREFEADRTAIELTGDPEGLAAALVKLERQQAAFWEHLVMPGRRVPDPSLLRTHPPIEERLRRLSELTPRPALALHRPARPEVDPTGHLDWIGPAGRRRPRWHVSGLWY